MYVRVGKTGSLGPWSRVIVYYSKLSFCQNDSPIGVSFWQKESLLQYTMTQLQISKYPVLLTLMYIYLGMIKKNIPITWDAITSQRAMGFEYCFAFWAQVIFSFSVKVTRDY